MLIFDFHGSPYPGCRTWGEVSVLALGAGVALSTCTSASGPCPGCRGKRDFGLQTCSSLGSGTAQDAYRNHLTKRPRNGGVSSKSKTSQRSSCRLEQVSVQVGRGARGCQRSVSCWVQPLLIILETSLNGT